MPMVRFSSLALAPAETRALLRQRLGSSLLSYRIPQQRPELTLLDDELAVRLLLGLRIDRECDLNRARSIYEDTPHSDSPEPTFQDLVGEGWIRVIWGRISAPVHMRTVREDEPSVRFAALLAKRHGQTFHFSEDARATPELRGLIDVIEAKARVQGVVSPQTPEWVAARLWDRGRDVSEDRISALRLWVDRWQALGAPPFAPSRVWSGADAEAFQESALEVIASAAGLDDWRDGYNRIVSELALGYNQPHSNIRDRVPPPPATYVGRALWLESNFIEAPLMESLQSCTAIFNLLGLLLADVASADLSPAPNILAERILVLADSGPDLLHMLIRIVQSRSILLADLLLYPATSVLACLLIAQWQFPHSAWDRELTSSDFRRARLSAFSDAVSVMCHFLSKQLVKPAEVAALLEWFHSSRGGRRGASPEDNLDAVLDVLRAELVSQPTGILEEIAGALTPSLRDRRVRASEFAAVLDVIDTGSLAEAVDPMPLLDAYDGSLADHSLATHRITQGAARALLTLAARLPAELHRRFLYPIDVKKRLTTGSGDDGPINPDSVARSIRAHIRVLSRAVAASPEAPSSDLVDALVAAIRMGALSHKEKGRLAAFMPRFDQGFGALDRPIAADIGAAISALTGDTRDRVLSAALETDEPALLAQLTAFVPHMLRGRIERRVSELDPSNVGEILLPTEQQARIDHLLTAGMANAAAKFIYDDGRRPARGRLPGQPLIRLYNDLRLSLLREDWAAISSTVPPADLNQMEEASAAETITFFRAIAELKRPGGDIDGAEQIFAGLVRHHPNNLAYTINLFAARINLLLRANVFGVLNGASLTRGHQLLADAERVVPTLGNKGASEVFSSNIALLRLAVGQPEQALRVLTSMQTVTLRDTVAAYTAVALARLERAPEALAGLKAAEDSYGLTDVLRAAGETVRKGAPFAAMPVIASERDPISQVRDARLIFLQLDHERQAQVMNSEPEPFDSLMIDYVRSSADSVISLVPVVKLEGVGPREDDITAILGHLLAAHTGFFGWTLGPSAGGITAKGNQGRRDIVLQKGTTTLTVIEAVRCDRPVTHEWMRQELTFHFQKLFSYASCRLFFHLTYATIDNPVSVITFLREAAKDDAPAGFVYAGCEEIPHLDSRPTGLIARYRGQNAEVKFVFLVLDLAQQAQREAAKLADKTNPRNRPRKSKRSAR
jgi:hypothetical protein